METTQLVDAFGYRECIKEAKRLISEGRAQLNSANRLYGHAEMFESIYHPYFCFEKEQEDAQNKEISAIAKITNGLEIYRCLLSYENLEHFTRIKNGIKGTLGDFENVLGDHVVEKYTNSLYVGPE